MEDFLDCNICYIRYDDSLRSPRQLPCQHVVCSDCLRRMVKKDQRSLEFIECPTCREKFYKRLAEIPKSLILVQLLDAARQSGSTPNSSVPNNRISSASTPSMAYYNNSTFAEQAPPLVKAPTNPYQAPPPYSSSAYNAPPTVPSHNSSQWNYTNYLKQIFNEMDTNRDGSITATELQQTLRRAQAGSDFNIKTVELLISRYDVDGDKQISFDEFSDLFNSLNEEFECFLMMDADGSGLIDLYEFKTALRNKGYSFSDFFFQYIMEEICLKSKKGGIQFDNYIRAMARFDYLCNFYHNTPYFQKNHNLEEYLRKTFFQDFW